MSSHLRKSPLAILALLALLALGGCGDSHTRVSTGTYAGESGKNAPYLNVGPLIYEVQLSRELNPANIEDAAYLQGLTPAESHLAPGRSGLRCSCCYTTLPPRCRGHERDGHRHPKQHLYTLGAECHQRIRLPRRLGAGQGELPFRSRSPARALQVALCCLYKIQVVSLDNRPLELKIVDPSNTSQTASAELDV